jgi:hypothetical protein
LEGGEGLGTDRGNEGPPIEAVKPARPLLVWLISLGYGFTALSSLVYTPLLLTGTVRVPEPYRSDLAVVAAPQWLFSIFGALLMLAFSRSIFRLRSTAVHWCEALMVLSVVATGYQLARVGLPAGALGPIAMASSTFSLGLLLAIYFYTRRLRSSGALA